MGYNEYIMPHGPRRLLRLLGHDLGHRHVINFGGAQFESLWTDEEQLATARERYLTPTELAEMLKAHPVEFFVADPGAPLKRISVDKCYEFWESEVHR